MATDRPRRDYGSGACYQEASGRWVAKLELPREDSTRRRKKVTGKTKAEALRRLAVLRTALARGQTPGTARVTMGELLTEWLETVQRPKVAPSTYEREATILRCHLLPALGHVRLDRLTAVDIQRYYARLRALPAAERTAPATLRLQHSVLRSALGAAVRWHWIPSNPAADVELPRKRPVRARQILDAAPARQFREAARGERLEALFVLALTSGARIGELLALRWSDLDLDAAEMTIARKLVHLHQGLVEDAPKTEAGARRLALHPLAVAALRRHQQRQREERLAAGAWAEPDRVFTNYRGAPLRASNVTSQNLQVLLAKAKLPRMTMHELRHSWCTLALKEGEDVAVVSRALGHSRVDVTLGIYRHVLAGEIAGVIGRVGDLLGADEGAPEGAPSEGEWRDDASESR